MIQLLLFQSILNETESPNPSLSLSLSCLCTWVSQLKCKRCNAAMTAYPILPMAWCGAHTCVSSITFDQLECYTPLQTRVAPSYQSPLASTATLCSLATRHHPTLDTNARISLNATQTRLPLATLFGPQTQAPLGLGAPSAQRTEGGRICGRIYTWSARGPAKDDAPRHTAWTAQFKSFNELRSLARNFSRCFKFLPWPF